MEREAFEPRPIIIHQLTPLDVKSLRYEQTPLSKQGKEQTRQFICAFNALFDKDKSLYYFLYDQSHLLDTPREWVWYQRGSIIMYGGFEHQAEIQGGVLPKTDQVILNTYLISNAVTGNRYIPTHRTDVPTLEEIIRREQAVRQLLLRMLKENISQEHIRAFKRGLADVYGIFTVLSNRTGNSALRNE